MNETTGDFQDSPTETEFKQFAARRTAPVTGSVTLVTGSGLVGCSIATGLAARGGRVILFDIAPDMDALRGITANGSIEVRTGDVASLADLQRVIEAEGVERIVHTAAMLTRASNANPLQALNVNVIGTANVLDLVRQKRLLRAVIVSSTLVGYPAFQRTTLQPIPEDFSMRVVSDRPSSFYGATKLTAEFLTQLYHDVHGVDCLVVRYGAILGITSGVPGGLPSRLLRTLLIAARKGVPAEIDDPLLGWKGGEEFLDLRDCVAGTIAAAFVIGPNQRIYTLSAGRMVSIDDLVAAIRKLYPQFSIQRFPEVSGALAGFPIPRPAPSDISAAKRDLGFEPIHDLASTVAYFNRVIESSEAAENS